MSVRTTYHHGDLKEALLEAGDAVLRDRGLEGFTLRECARRAGVSHAAPKHHFGDARGFLTAIATRGFERLAAILREHLAEAGGDLEAEFLATAKAYVSFADRYPEHFRIMFRYDLVDGDAPVLETAVRDTLTELTNVILRQRGEPELTPEALGHLDSRELVNDIVIGWCHVHGYAHLRLEQQLSMVPDEHLELLATASRRLGRMIRTDARRRG